jgi:hypothetical protein
MSKGKTPPPNEPPTTTGPSSALVRPPNDEEAAALAALAEAGFGEDAADGLSEVVANDMRTPLKLFNVKKGEAINGKVVQDCYYDTIDRTVAQELNLVLLELHKSHSYKKWNNKDQVNELVCQSYDRVTGTLAETDTQRPCKGCPDFAWRRSADGKREQPCSEVWNVAAFDLDAQKVCLLKFKRTSLDPIRNHLQAHHMGRRPLPGGKRGNIPLFAYRVKLTIAMHKSGNFAVPAIERGAMLSVNDLKFMHETADAVREQMQERLQASEADEGEAGAPDVSFDTAAMDAASAAERGTQAFVD